MQTKETFSISPSQKQLLPVCFHNHNLFLVEHNQEPYVPMRPVVEGIGLSWKPQYAKLNSNRSRWGVTLMVTPSEGGRQRTVTMPLKKLPGFLATINPLKVKNELRGKVVLFQNECDDALWRYWNGVTKKAVPAKEETITPSQQRKVQLKVASKVDNVNGSRKEFETVYGILKKHFSIPRYTEIPYDKFDQAMDFIDKIKLEPIKKEAPIVKEEVSLDSLIVSVLPEISRETKWSVLCMMSSHLAGVKHDINYKY